MHTHTYIHYITHSSGSVMMGSAGLVWFGTASALMGGRSRHLQKPRCEVGF